MRSQRARSGRGRIVLLCGVVAVLEASALAGCVDGVTPDCSDAATQCGPNIDASRSLDSSDASRLPEAAAVDSAAADAQGDTSVPIDLDAGDEG